MRIDVQRKKIETVGWITMYFDDAVPISAFNFSTLNFRINGKIYTEYSKEFEQAYLALVLSS